MRRMVRSRRPAPPSAEANEGQEQPDPAAEELAKLTYNQARTALDLVLAELQARDLDVEAMAQLYRQGQTYARYCESILERVEQEVLIWEADSSADQGPRPYTADPRSES